MRCSKRNNLTRPDHVFKSQSIVVEASRRVLTPQQKLSKPNAKIVRARRSLQSEKTRLLISPLSPVQIVNLVSDDEDSDIQKVRTRFIQCPVKPIDDASIICFSFSSYNLIRLQSTINVKSPQHPIYAHNLFDRE